MNWENTTTESNAWNLPKGETEIYWHSNITNRDDRISKRVKYLLYDQTANHGGQIAFFLVYRIQVAQKRFSTVIPYFTFFFTSREDNWYFSSPWKRLCTRHDRTRLKSDRPLRRGDLHRSPPLVLGPRPSPACAYLCTYSVLRVLTCRSRACRWSRGGWGHPGRTYASLDRGASVAADEWGE